MDPEKSFLSKSRGNLISALTVLRHLRLFLDTFLIHSTSYWAPLFICVANIRLLYLPLSLLRLMSGYVFKFWSCLSPGDIGTLNTSHEMIKLMPKLSPQDVADAVLYAISTPENVLVSLNFYNRL